MTPEIKKAVEDLGADWAAFRKTNDDILARKADGKAVADLESKLVRIEANMAAGQKIVDDATAIVKAQADRIDQVEARFQDLRTMGAKGDNAIARKHADLFDKFVRGKSNNSSAAMELQQFERSPEGKAIATNVNSTGGFAVPEEISRQIADAEQLLSPVRSLVRVVQAGTPDYKELISVHNSHAGGWVGETTSRSETANAGLRERAPTFGTLYAYPKATEESLNDVFFNVQQFLVDHSSLTFAQMEGIACLTGSGSARPTGMLNSAPVATDDDASPERGAGVLELVPIAPGASPMGVITADGVMDLVYSLRAGYRAGATFAMNTVTQGKVRKLKDTTNNYLWAPSLAAGQPPTLMGYPVATFEDLANPSANAIPVLFGNFARGYLLVDLVGLRITVDEVTTPGYVKYYVRRRVGGCILDNYAIKAGKCVSA